MSQAFRLVNPCLMPLVVAAALIGVCDCTQQSERGASTVPVYQNQGYRPDIPDFMHGTINERADLANTDPYMISGYSLVVNLHNTGDNSQLPRTVREAMIKQMVLEGFGTKTDPRFTNLQPEDVLKDKRVAVVQVKGYLPVGARKGQRFDLIVQAMPRSATSSLAHGHLYKTELRNRGIEQPSGGGMILAYADDGDIFVNPEYALLTNTTSAQVKASLRSGVVMGQGNVTEDRPIYLQLRVPQASISREIEGRVINRFQADADKPAAAAQDEGIVALYVPVSFVGDWRHFIGIVDHLYLNDSPDFNAQKAAQLVVAARKPGAALTDISYCLEGLGPNVLPIYQALIKDPDPNIAFAAARAAVFAGDPGAMTALTQMAVDPANPYQLASVHTLGELPTSPAVDKQLEPLLASDQTLVRIEAYKILAAHRDRMIQSQYVDYSLDHTTNSPNGFMLDVIDCGGPPLVYATRSGQKRLAIFGHSPAITPPIMYSALDSRLTISSNDFGTTLTMFYRDPRKADPVNVQSGLEISEIAARLGGRGAPGTDTLDFTYGDVVAIVQALAESHRIMGQDDAGQVAAAPFVMEQPAELTAALAGAPSVDSRPQGDPLLPPGHTGKPTETPTGVQGMPDLNDQRPSGKAPPTAMNEVPKF